MLKFDPDDRYLPTVYRGSYYAEKIFYKVMDETMKHYNFQYTIGLNILSREYFNPDGDCQKGGLYFCDIDDILYWLHLHKNGQIYEVRLPDDARVCKQFRKYKADRIHISNPMQIHDFIRKHNLEKQARKECPEYIEKMNACTINVKKECPNINYKNDKLCQYKMRPIEANMHEILRTHGSSIKDMFIQDPYLCMFAVQINPFSLEHIRDQTIDICMEALRGDIAALWRVRNQTTEICVKAITLNKSALKYIRDQNYDICIKAVKINGLALEHVKNQTIDICKHAIAQNKMALMFVDYEYLEQCFEFIQGNMMII